MPQAKKKPAAETQPETPETQPEPDAEPQTPEPEPEPQEPQTPQTEPQPVGNEPNVPHPTTVRGPIESQFNKQRDERGQKHREDRVELEQSYLSDLREIQEAKSRELAGAGLNPDGSTPPDYSG